MGNNSAQIDRETLILAAKAAGVELAWNGGQSGYPSKDGTIFDGSVWLTPWNPLKDDGDAFRLAYAIDAEIHNGMVLVDKDTCYYRYDYLDIEGLRRGIVNAAAEFAKTL